MKQLANKYTIFEPSTTKSSYLLAHLELQE